MKVTLTHDGKSVELDLTAEQMAALGLKEEKKKTGYERGGLNHDYWYAMSDGSVSSETETLGLNVMYANDRFNEANYYSDEDIAVANHRADRLMRRLRRFAAENGGIPSVEDWDDEYKLKYSIRYHYPKQGVVSRFGLVVSSKLWSRDLGIVYFNSEGACGKAIEKFHDELIWYFTEYEAMLR